MLARIGDINFVAKEVEYDVICKTRYQTRADQVKNQGNADRKISSCHRLSLVYEEAFQSICHLIQEEIIERNEVFLMNDSKDQCIAISLRTFLRTRSFNYVKSTGFGS